MNYTRFCSYCRDGYTKNVEDILRDNKTINILWNDGELLKCAAENGHAKILEMLINYHLLQIGLNKESNEYTKLTYHLVTAKYLCTDDSKELEKLLREYIPEEYEEELSTEDPIIATAASVSAEAAASAEAARISITAPIAAAAIASPKSAAEAAIDSAMSAAEAAAAATVASGKAAIASAKSAAAAITSSWYSTDAAAEADAAYAAKAALSINSIKSKAAADCAADKTLILDITDKQHACEADWHSADAWDATQADHDSQLLGE